MAGALAPDLGSHACLTSTDTIAPGPVRIQGKYGPDHRLGRHPASATGPNSMDEWAGRARATVRGPLWVLRQYPRSLRNCLVYCNGVVLEMELQVGDA
jgi:hypothetical protein